MWIAAGIRYLTFVINGVPLDVVVTRKLLPLLLVIDAGILRLPTARCCTVDAAVTVVAAAVVVAARFD
jgi:hypothetical protein